MNIVVVSTWNNRLYENYAHNFLDTYNWSFPTIIYNEDVDMFQKIPECFRFVERNKHREFSNWLYDGVRFCYKVYAYTDAIFNIKCDGLIFLDADCTFLKPMDMNWIKNNLHHEEHMLVYLGRQTIPKQCPYSEVGFVYFNINHPHIQDFAQKMREMYDLDRIYDLSYYHDAWVFDHVRKKFEEDLDVQNNNIGYKIGDEEPDSHVQWHSILGEFFRHHKGEKKWK